MTKQNPSTEKYWLALRFYTLPFNAINADTHSTPAVVLDKNIVICANQQAMEQGIKIGMNNTTVQALSDCQLLTRNHQQEQQLLLQLSTLLYEFTPYINTYVSSNIPEQGLLLELSRCLKLFHGLKNLCEKIFNALHNTPYDFYYGLAHTEQAAWVLSWQQHNINGKEQRSTFLQRLNTIQLHQLHDFPSAVKAMEKAGFRTLGDIAKQMRVSTISAFRKRYGNAFAEYLRQLFGIEQNLQQTQLFTTPATVFTPIENFYDAIQFDYPVTSYNQLIPTIEKMLQSLTEYLIIRQEQCQKITWQLYDIYHNVQYIHVYCDNQQRNWQLLLELTRIQMENNHLHFEVDTIELVCCDTTPLSNPHRELNFGYKKSADPNAFSVTLAKLKARLGENSLFKISYFDSYLPEKSNTTIAPEKNTNQNLPTIHRIAIRPRWIFDTPIPLSKKNNRLYWNGYIEPIGKPERIDTQWWDKPAHRDYFFSRRDDNTQLWIFLDRKQQSWWVHGIFG